MNYNDSQLLYTFLEFCFKGFLFFPNSPNMDKEAASMDKWRYLPHCSTMFLCKEPFRQTRFVRSPRVSDASTDGEKNYSFRTSSFVFFWILDFFDAQTRNNKARASYKPWLFNDPQNNPPVFTVLVPNKTLGGGEMEDRLNRTCFYFPAPHETVRKLLLGYLKNVRACVSQCFWVVFHFSTFLTIQLLIAYLTAKNLVLFVGLQSSRLVPSGFSSAPGNASEKMEQGESRTQWSETFLR